MRPKADACEKYRYKHQRLAETDANHSRGKVKSKEGATILGFGFNDWLHSAASAQDPGFVTQRNSPQWVSQLKVKRTDKIIRTPHLPPTRFA